MQRHSAKRLYETEVDDLGGGLNQDLPPNKVPIRECIRMKNARIPTNGRTKIKRPGLTKLDSLYSFSGKKVFGVYGIEESDEVKIPAYLEDDIQLKSGGAWSSIFSPTKTIDKPVSIAQFKGLTFVAGYEKLITIKGNEAFYSGIEAPQSAPTVAAQATGADAIAAEYATANQDKCGQLRVVNAQTLLAQGFKVLESSELTKVKLKLKKIGSPTGNLWVEIHCSRAGTSATKNASSNIVGQGTDDLDVSTIAGSFTTYELTFSGTKPTISPDTVYYLVVYGNFTVSTTNYIEVGFDCSGPNYEDGKYWTINDSLGWLDEETVDLVFEIYGTSEYTGELLSYGARKTGAYYGIRSNPNYMLAQSFKLSSGSEISKVTLAVKKRCAWRYPPPGPDPIPPVWVCPEGNIWVEIHSSQSGTSATKGASANIVGGASDNVNLDNVPEDFTWIEFNFSGTKPPLSASTTYYIVFYCSHGVETDPAVGEDWTKDTSPYADGQAWHINSSMTWGSKDNDMSFKVYGTLTGEGKVAEYALSNLDDTKELRETTAQTLFAQSFKVQRSQTATKVNLYLSKIGSPTGNMWVEIHTAQGGTSATKETSTNILGQASDDLDVSTISAFPTFTQYTLTFSGTKPDLVKDTTYYLVIYGDYAVSTSAYIKVGHDKIDPQYTNGSRWEINDSMEWTEKAHVDFLFELYLTFADIVGTYKYVTTFYRGGNYPAESNPSEASESVTVAENEEINITNIPISSEPEVTARCIYRTQNNGVTFYWVHTIEDNTTTSWQDTIPDAGLGHEVSYKNGLPPLCDSIEVWEDSLWTNSDEYPEHIYRSEVGWPESFYVGNFIALREREADRVRKLKEYDNEMYALKNNSIWCVSRHGEESYLPDKVVHGTGTQSPESVVVTSSGLMVLLSNHKKIEVFDGKRIFTPRASNRVKKVLESINKDHLDKCSADDYVDENEYRLAVPTGSNTTPDTVIVYNYVTQNFYIDGYHQHISFIISTPISLGEMAMLYGTVNGEIYKVDPTATTDDGNYIEMDIQTGWIHDAKWTHIKRIYADIILPANKTLIIDVYSNFSEEASVEHIITGSTPSGSDPDLRSVIHQRMDMNVQGNYFSLRFLNSDDTDKLEIIKLWFYSKKRAVRQTIKAA